METNTHPELIRRPREPPAVCNPETNTVGVGGVFTVSQKQCIELS